MSTTSRRPFPTVYKFHGHQFPMPPTYGAYDILRNAACGADDDTIILAALTPDNAEARWDEMENERFKRQQEERDR